MSKNDNEYRMLILERSLEIVEYILKHSFLDDEKTKTINGNS